MDKHNLKYIVVEGPIGVGKTSLAQRLSDEFGSTLLLEDVDDNPFLERFYQNPREAALSTQLYFLLQRTKQLQEFKQGDIFTPVRVADFLIEKDRLFAQVTLNASEYELYEQIYSHLTIDAPKPDLVVYLQAPVEVLLQRIRKRGRGYERLVETVYLEQLNEAYAKFFYDYNDAPCLIVNASDIDFINNDKDYEQLLGEILNTEAGKRYFNPLPFVS
ncbi:MAG: deoxynucleoside kinase [Gammaproteobacteria bacterium]|mgnify:CR=1 FL=1|nr:deoxynucleoside kinase [Gammaproteobacteria bacterium]